MKQLVKRCSRCGKVKSIDGFYRDRRHQDGLASHCKECQGVAQHIYYETHRKERLAYYQQWHQANRDKILTRRRAYYWEYWEKELARTYHWKERNPEKVAAQKHRYYERHRNERMAYDCQWAKENPEKKASNKARRRARLRALPSTLSNKEARQKLSVGHCFYCGATGNLELDHFVPLGAVNNEACGTTRANTVVACRNCNSSKKARMPADILAQKELDLGQVI